MITFYSLYADAHITIERSPIGIAFATVGELEEWATRHERALRYGLGLVRVWDGTWDTLLTSIEEKYGQCRCTKPEDYCGYGQIT